MEAPLNMLEQAAQSADFTLDSIKAEKIALMNCIEGMVIANDNDHKIALDLLKRLKERLKWLEADRTSITQPINAGLALINAKYKPTREFFEKPR